LIIIKIDVVARREDGRAMTITPPTLHPVPADPPGDAVASPLEVPAGLKGLVVADTTIGDVRGAEGFYHYRQHSAVELAEVTRFEDVARLLLLGELPDADEAARFSASLAVRRQVPETALAALPALVASGAPPLALLATALSITAGALGLRPMVDLGPAERLEDALTLVGVLPTLVAAAHRLSLGLEPLPPDAGLGHAADYLRMLSGRVPDPAEARAIDRYLVLTADHGFNASTFAGRVIASTGADLGACLVGALGALSGPLHGGAPSRALDLLDEIGDPVRAGAVVEAHVVAGERIMGFGHAVYVGEDPRSLLLGRIAGELGGERAELAHAAERAVTDALARLKPERDLRTNVEFYAGVVMERCGIPRELFTSTFAVSRAAGWSAHALEQVATRRIIRPSARYVGPAPASPTGGAGTKPPELPAMSTLERAHRGQFREWSAREVVVPDGTGEGSPPCRTERWSTGN
jgi:citrate synthase